MKISVLIGIKEDGTSEPISSGIYEDLSKVAKELAIENKTEFVKTRIFTQYLRQWKCAPKEVKSIEVTEEKKGRGRPKKEA
jgi:hypothetical protein